jgi:chorismate lyase / 3-hydroxybenzoate synthase
MTRQLHSRALTSRFEPISGPVPGALGVVNYTNTTFNPESRGGHATLNVQLVEDPASSFAEVWCSPRPVESGEHKAIAFSHDGEYLFCAGRIPPCTEHTYAGRLAFRAALELAGTLGYHHVFRMWNYLDDLTPRTYQDFLLGQAEAFAKRPVTWSGLPTATAVRSLGGGTAFHLLACRTGVPVTIIAATGARGTFLHDRLYFSASSLDDVEHLISKANLRDWGIDRGYELSDLTSLKVYVRNPDQMAAVQYDCESRLLAETAVAYLHAGLLHWDRTAEFEGVAG